MLIGADRVVVGFPSVYCGAPRPYFGPVFRGDGGRDPLGERHCGCGMGVVEPHRGQRLSDVAGAGRGRRRRPTMLRAEMPVWRLAKSK